MKRRRSVHYARPEAGYLSIRCARTPPPHRCAAGERQAKPAKPPPNPAGNIRWSAGRFSGLPPTRRVGRVQPRGSISRSIISARLILLAWRMILANMASEPMHHPAPAFPMQGQRQPEPPSFLRVRHPGNIGTPNHQHNVRIFFRRTAGSVLRFSACRPKSFRVFQRSIASLNAGPLMVASGFSVIPVKTGGCNQLAASPAVNAVRLTVSSASLFHRRNVAFSLPLKSTGSAWWPGENNTMLHCHPVARSKSRRDVRCLSSSGI